MVKLRRITPPAAASRRRSLATVADSIIDEAEHGRPVEHPRLRGEQLVRAVRNLASVGRSIDSIARELGIHSVDKVIRLRQALDCPGALDVEPAPAEPPERSDEPPEAA